MKNTPIFLLLGLALFFSLPAQAQSSGCGTPPPVERAPEAVSDRSVPTGPFIFQLFVHILRDDNGSNAAITENGLYLMMDSLSRFYPQRNICFILAGWDYINSTLWNSNYNSNQINALHAVNPHPFAIDMYLHRLDFTTDGQLGGGNAYTIPSTKCSVSMQSGFNFIHELGHCLGLAHTFEVANGTDCPGGSNCGQFGDGVCDTPPDFRALPAVIASTGCTFTGSNVCNGQFLLYQPQTTNIMSYWNWQNCTGQFTTGQGNKMRTTISENNFLLNRLALADMGFSGVTYTQEVAFGASHSMTIGKLNNNGPVLMNGNVHGVFNAGVLIRILPDTRISPTGTGSVIFRSQVSCPGVVLLAGEEEERATEINQETTLSTEALTVAPNPFTGSTTIAYSLSTAQDVDLRIFSSVGNLVAQPIRQEFQEAGKYAYLFDAAGLPAGVYFLVMQTNGHRLTKQLVLSR